MDFKEKYGKWALIAGGAEGLGEAFCLSLADKGMNVVIVDFKEKPLMELSEKLEARGILVTPLLMDLQEPGSAQKILSGIEGLDCRLMIYNAAYSRVKKFLDHPAQELDQYIDVNIRTPMKLVHGFSSSLINKGKRGGILLMSSLAGLIGMQLVAPYAATKAANWNLAEALHHELAEHHIDIMACIAGPTSTQAYLDTRPQYGSFKPEVMAPGKVAALAMENLGKRTLYIPGYFNRISYFILTRMLPRKVAASVANGTMGKMYRHLP